MTKKEQNKPKQFIRLEKIRTLLGVSQSTLDKWSRDGAFINKVKLNHRISVYIEEDFIQWQNERIEASKKANSNEENQKDS